MTIVLAVVPPDDKPHRGVAIAKVIGSTLLFFSAGVTVFLNGARSKRA
jgi:hypothetical protein